MDNIQIKRELDPDYKKVENIIPIKRIRLENEEDPIKNYERLVQVFQREFQKEISFKREEVHKIQQQLLKAQKTLHLLKYIVVKSFYDNKELKVTNTNEIPVLQSLTSNSNLVDSLNNAQNRIHPAIKKLLNKKPLNYIPYRTRNKNNLSSKRITRKEENVTIKEENADELTNIKLEQPEIEKSTFDNSKIVQEDVDKNICPVRNREKAKYCILVGNISKWIPSNCSQDNSTHKWMVYVRGPKENPDISHIVKKVRFFLHPSYQPNDIVDIHDAPFHLSRRGWGEFPLRVQIHFKNSTNKPVDIIHNIKLDRTYTGLQTMGEETLVNVWIYDTEDNNENCVKKACLDTNLFTVKEELFENSKKEKIPKNPIEKCHINNCVHLADFIESCENILKELDEVEINIKTIYEDAEENKSELPTDSSSIHEDLLINKKSDVPSNEICDSYESQISLLNNIGVKEFANIDRVELNSRINYVEEETFFLERDIKRIYLEDHCYTKLKESPPYNNSERQLTKKVKCVLGKNSWTLDANFIIDKEKYVITVPLENLNSISQIIYYLFKHLPLVTELAKDISYTCLYPYVASSLEQYLSWNPAKQFCSEWYRAKHIKRFLADNDLEGHQHWSVKIIIMFGQAHGFSHIDKYELFHKRSVESGKTVPVHSETLIDIDTRTEIISFKELLDFKNSLKDLGYHDGEIDVLNAKTNQTKDIKHKSISCNNDYNNIDEFSLACVYIRQTAQQLGINLNPEEVTEGVHDRLAEKVILKAVMCLAEELIRKSLANNLVEKRFKNSEKEISKHDIFNVLSERDEFSIFSNTGLGKRTDV